MPSIFHPQPLVLILVPVLVLPFLRSKRPWQCPRAVGTIDA
ncbi:hypothetical protein ACIBO9_01355 [Streptomyces prunicolor]